MEAYECLVSRRSVRKFLPDPLPADTAERLVASAVRAATARNEQPWLFVAVEDPARRKALKDLCPDNGPYIEFAPLCIAVFSRKANKYYLEDGSAATQNILNAAHALGFGAVWVAGDKKDYVEAVRRLLGVPEEFTLVSLVPVGYPDGPTVLTERKPVAEVLVRDGRS